MCERQEQGSSGRGHGKDAVKGRVAIRGEMSDGGHVQTPSGGIMSSPSSTAWHGGAGERMGMPISPPFVKKKKKILKWTATYKDLWLIRNDFCCGISSFSSSVVVDLVVVFVLLLVKEVVYKLFISDVSSSQVMVHLLVNVISWIIRLR